eukprot:CAMPEP_0115118532 /NCGR_PEP_ID=MMETSP0227-20121206/44548_1 /TAXON_ID=89957 /ORGANISM="Polarella glacialis, Strain CCMP 1383" /LENGTH=328 /DNA_ID=CAMNT_0002519821 /DNA_START=52 /DNA_END=1038 /DNA_ORIENTATION=-
MGQACCAPSMSETRSDARQAEVLASSPRGLDSGGQLQESSEQPVGASLPRLLPSCRRSTPFHLQRNSDGKVSSPPATEGEEGSSLAGQNEKRLAAMAVAVAPEKQHQEQQQEQQQQHILINNKNTYNNSNCSVQSGAGHADKAQQQQQVAPQQHQERRNLAHVLEGQLPAEVQCVAEAGEAGASRMPCKAPSQHEEAVPGNVTFGSGVEVAEIMSIPIERTIHRPMNRKPTPFVFKADIAAQLDKERRQVKSWKVLERGDEKTWRQKPSRLGGWLSRLGGRSAAGREPRPDAEAKEDRDQRALRRQGTGFLNQASARQVAELAGEDSE